MASDLGLPEIHDRHAFNLARWKEIRADPHLARIEGRVESDAYGRAVLSPLADFSHASRQGAILLLLARKAGGDPLVACPISTGGGVRAVDVCWISDGRCRIAVSEDLLLIAPEICVEVLAAGNRVEMDEKRGLLFGAGAVEVWFCDKKGRMFFFMKEAPDVAVEVSRLYPEFPAVVE